MKTNPVFKGQKIELFKVLTDGNYTYAKEIGVIPGRVMMGRSIDTYCEIYSTSHDIFVTMFDNEAKKIGTLFIKALNNH